MPFTHTISLRASAWMLASTLVAAPASALTTFDNNLVSFASLVGSEAGAVVPGGDVAFLSVYDQAALAMTGGQISHLHLYDTTSGQISGGAVSHLWAFDQARLDLDGGQFSHLDLNDATSAEISGGDIGHLTVRDAASLTLTGLHDLSFLVVDGDRATVRIVADQVSYSFGHLSGQWATGASFSFWAYDESAGPGSTLPSNIQILSAVPEPASWALMGLGLALMAGVARGARRRV